MPEDILDQVRAGCKSVAEKAKYVRIDDQKISAYANSLLQLSVSQAEHDAGSHYLGHGAATVAFFVTLDTINFGSGYFPHLKKRPGMSGYFTIASSLKDFFSTHGAFTATALSQLSQSTCMEIFEQEADNKPVMELMGLFASALNELGVYLLETFAGNFSTLVETAANSSAQLVQLLSKMPMFRDVETYQNQDVPFYKRAQLMVSDLCLAFNGQGPGYFTDLDRLTIFADNLVPHVLRLDGLLQYDPGLARRIDREELIPAGSAEEVEIRACALHAVELLSNALHTAGHDVPSMQLDYLLWNRGQAPYYKRSKPRHRTRTIFY
jgi:Potential Queuosine, Q, salvage protein family